MLAIVSTFQKVSTRSGQAHVQAYDGNAAWQISLFGDKREPKPMSPEEFEELEEGADLDGPLMDYKAKGHGIELLEKTTLDGRDSYKLKVTLSNRNILHVYLDAASFLQIRADSKRTIRGSEVEVETLMSDYRDVAGVPFPYLLQSGVKGAPQKQSITIDKVELNPSLEDARFRMPKGESP